VRDICFFRTRFPRLIVALVLRLLIVWVARSSVKDKNGSGRFRELRFNQIDR